MNTTQLRHSLRNARFEVLPLRGVTADVGQLPIGTTVPVTSSPAKGPEATMDLAAHLAGIGLHPVPHLAARSIVDRAHLASLLDRMADQDLTEVFVIAGDSPVAAGRFPDALALLRAMEQSGRRPRRVGIAGYPERHPFISDASTIRAMADKARHADYVVSQICYDPAATKTWVKAVRARGLFLPIYVGVPGVADVTKLLKVSLKIGLGESIRFLRKQHGAVSKLLTRYTPEELIDELSPALLDSADSVAGWHFFTFNEIGRTLRWRDEFLARLQEVPA
jgi:methylenetetrahydrofolate reductase (NADPH)